MKVIGLIVLVLELISLTITLKDEMDKNNFTFTRFKSKIILFFNKLKRKE